MANILSVENLTKSFGDSPLFADISFGVAEGEKIGIIARNGTGKSTLMRILAGEEAPDAGNIVYRNGIRRAFLPQQPVFEPELTIEEIARRAAAGSEERRLRLNQLMGQLEISDMSAKAHMLSGGQRKRLALAITLLDNPDFLMLDEPTNHLDLKTIEWLENYLRRYRATLLMVTHDRYFLDRVCNRIIELDQRTIFSVQGNYDMYLRRRAERIEAAEAQVTKARNTLRKEQEWMSRQPQARAGKAKFRIDAFYELSEKAKGVQRQANVSLDTRSSRIGSKIFEAKGISKAFGDKVILRDFSYTFARGEKVGIVGHNGVGKSTLIKMLQGLEPTDAGEWNVGTTVRFGYYSQDGISFDDRKKVIDAVEEIAEDIRLKEGMNIAPMQYLQRFLFSPSDQQKYISKLSGGERCRLHLATVLMQQPNFLILDEPTNDLDIVTLGILEEYLASFEGCVIVVSHDRFFLDSIVDHLFVMEGDGVVRDFPGNYSDYRLWRDEYNRQIAAENAPAKEVAQKPRRQDRPAKMSFKERLEFEQLEKEINQLGEEKAQLEQAFTSGGDGDIQKAAARYAQIKELLDEKEMRWLELSEKA